MPERPLRNKTSSDLEWTELLGKLAAQCRLPEAGLRALALAAPSDESALAALLNTVEEASDLERSEQLPAFSPFEDLAPSLRALSKGAVLDGPALSTIAAALASIDRVAGSLRKLASRSPSLNLLAMPSRSAGGPDLSSKST